MPSAEKKLTQLSLPRGPGPAQAHLHAGGEAGHHAPHTQAHAPDQRSAMAQRPVWKSTGSSVAGTKRFLGWGTVTRSVSLRYRSSALFMAAFFTCAYNMCHSPCHSPVSKRNRAAWAGHAPLCMLIMQQSLMQPISFMESFHLLFLQRCHHYPPGGPWSLDQQECPQPQCGAGPWII